MKDKFLGNNFGAHCIFKQTGQPYSESDAYKKVVATRLKNLERKLSILGIEKYTEFILCSRRVKNGYSLCQVTNIPLRSDCVIEFKITASSCPKKPKSYLGMHDFIGEIIIVRSSPKYEEIKMLHINKS